jgi:predicted transposase/invertase (TIGR01784 family)
MKGKSTIAKRKQATDSGKKTAMSNGHDEVNLIEHRERLLQEAGKLNLLSNVFMSVAMDEKEACQYVLRILTGINDLVVKEIRSQYRINKITSKDAILDILAEDTMGRLYSVEIQRKDTIDHAKRTRFYGAMVDSEFLRKGKGYTYLPKLFVIYISETDLWNAGYTTYPVEKHFKNTNIPYDDGLQVIYVNAAVDDGSETARLMQYFKTADPKDMSHGELSRRVHYLKDEGGFVDMCDVSETIYSWGVEQGIKQGVKKGVKQGVKQGAEAEKVRSLRNLMDSLALSLDEAMSALKLPKNERQHYANLLQK